MRHCILFQKHAVAVAADSNSVPPPVETSVEEQNPEQDRVVVEEVTDQFLERVTSFCIKHDVEVSTIDGGYVPYEKSAGYVRARNKTNDGHFKREVYIDVIDQISQELDNRFDEINVELLSCMSAFRPSNSFISFDERKVHRLAEFYPKDFSNNDLLKLELQLDNYIDDMLPDDSFFKGSGGAKAPTE